MRRCQGGDKPANLPSFLFQTPSERGGAALSRLVGLGERDHWVSNPFRAGQCGVAAERAACQAVIGRFKPLRCGALRPLSKPMGNWIKAIAFQTPSMRGVEALLVKIRQCAPAAAGFKPLRCGALRPFGTPPGTIVSGTAFQTPSMRGVEALVLVEWTTGTEQVAFQTPSMRGVEALVHNEQSPRRNPPSFKPLRCGALRPFSPSTAPQVAPFKFQTPSMRGVEALGPGGGGSRCHPGSFKPLRCGALRPLVPRTGRSGFDEYVSNPFDAGR